MLSGQHLARPRSAVESRSRGGRREANSMELALLLHSIAGCSGVCQQRRIIGLCAPPPPSPQGCIRREGTSEAASEAVRQAVGGGLPKRSGAVILSVTTAIEAGTCRQGGSGWA